MPKRVDHEQRKEAILGAALDVFARVGYKDTTLSLIAEEAGIPRTVVYQYYHDKNEVLYSVIKAETMKIFISLSALAFGEGGGTEPERLAHIYDSILDAAVENKESLANLIIVMVDATRNGSDTAAVVKKRTAKLMILIKRLLVKGMKVGSFKPGLDVDSVSESFFSMAELICFSVAVFGHVDKDAELAKFSTYLETIKA